MAETPYNKRQERAESGTDPRELPEVVSRAVIADVEQQSVALQLATPHRMSARQEKLTLEASFPDAYWLNGTTDYPTLSSGGGVNNASGSQRAKDSQPKQTTKMTWDTKTLAAEEIAVMVVIPDAYIDDSGVPLFDEIRPKLATAIAKKLDAAILFSDDSPFTQNGIVEDAILHGNVVTLGSSDDLASDVALLGQEAAEEGVDFSTFVSGPGFKWRLPGLRSADGFPIYSPPAAGNPGTLYGVNIQEVKNGQWNSELALLLAGEWDKVHIGIRQDITFSLSDSGVIFDPATQKVVYSAFQQDGKILRAVMRVAYTVVNPVRHLDNLYPFWILQDRSLS